MLNLTQNEWREAMTLLDQVMDLEKEKQQDALRRSTASDNIRKVVQRLLSHEDDASDDALDQGAFNLVAPVVKSDDEFDSTAARALETLGSGTGGRRPRPGELERGTTVGSFRVERLIGRGGMGEVYLAKRTDDFEQDVALKLVRVAGLGSEEVDRRFKRERQILAGLRHENIARLIDGGMTEDQRPYLAMEYVDGEQITDYADRNGLNIDERMALFEQVGRAVRYAHRRAIIHRDLKPSNLMVEEQSASSGDNVPGKGRPVVKLLDFGIAKLLEADDEPLTRGGERLMTPEYAAPEQISGQPVTTSTDVYQLGVLMYELLTGRRPFYEVTEGKSGRARVRAAEDAILGKDPERPSRVLTRSVDTLRKTHGMDLKRLAGRVRGDLDAIVQKALRKEPGERYSSVTELLEDIDRYRSGHPVQARSGTWSYRAKKFLRRNRTPVIAGTIAALVLIGFVVSLIVTTSQLSRALTEVQAEAERREEVQDVFISILDVAEPGEDYTDTLTVREMLRRSREKASYNFANYPDLKAWVFLNLARYETSFGRRDEARALLDSATILYDRLQRPLTPQVKLEIVDVLELSGINYRDSGRLDRSKEEYERALSLLMEVKDEKQPLEAGFMLKKQPIAADYINAEVSCRTGYLTVLAKRGDDEAENQRVILKSLIDSNEERLRRGTIAFAYREIAKYVYESENNVALADSLLRQVLKIRKEEYGYYSDQVKSVYSALGVMYGREGDIGKSSLYITKAHEILKRILPSDSPEMVQSLSNVAAVHALSDSLQKALPLLDRALRISTSEYGEDDAMTMELLIRRGNILKRLGRFEEAEDQLTRVVKTRKRTEGPMSIKTGNAHAVLASLYMERGKYVEGAEERRTAISSYRAVYNAGKYERGSTTYTELVKRYAGQYASYYSELETRNEDGKRCRVLMKWNRLIVENDALKNEVKTPETRSLRECDMLPILPTGD